MPVVDEDKRLCGVVAFADALLTDDPARAGVAMSDVVAPGGEHRQTA